MARGIVARYQTEASDSPGAACSRSSVTGGYGATREACQECLRSYRIGGARREGNSSVYALSRQDLRRWCYGDKLSPTALQEKHLQEHGVFADRSHMVQWCGRPAQRPETLDSSESIHAHPSGEYVLERLQAGTNPVDVVEGLMREHLVEASCNRALADRRYSEEHWGYFTVHKLEVYHWQKVYALVIPESSLAEPTARGIPRRGIAERHRVVRTTCCDGTNIAEERAPLERIAELFRKHEAWARLPLQYPSVTLLRDSLPLHLVHA